MVWTGQAAHKGGDKKCIQNLSENLKGRYHLGDLGIDGRIILKGILNDIITNEAVN
jgi:hypothetical protein